LVAGGGTYANTRIRTSTNGGSGYTARYVDVSGRDCRWSNRTSAHYQQVGRSLNYSYLVTNTGSVSLYSPLPSRMIGGTMGIVASLPASHGDTSTCTPAIASMRRYFCGVGDQHALPALRHRAAVR
jgi:hypothetical protein